MQLLEALLDHRLQLAIITTCTIFNFLYIVFPLHRLYFAEKPFTTAILKSLRFSMEYELELRRLEDQKQLKKGQSPQNKVLAMFVL